MSNPTPIHSDDKMKQIASQLERLQGGGGGGSFDGMIERIVRLEAKLEHVQTDVTDLRADMKEVRDRLKGVEVKVDHLPSKGFIVSGLLLMVAATGALITLQEQIQSLLN